MAATLIVALLVEATRVMGERRRRAASDGVTGEAVIYHHGASRSLEDTWQAAAAERKTRSKSGQVWGDGGAGGRVAGARRRDRGQPRGATSWITKDSGGVNDEDEDAVGDNGKDSSDEWRTRRWCGSVLDTRSRRKKEAAGEHVTAEHDGDEGAERGRDTSRDGKDEGKGEEII
ncbi:hypothetical protein BV25DRAFT_1840668 [Artomyces pyxidatus]|uniref:Uncharacterized protein n=1 Tax=Artomyces pyxidatus TaxID=48021 RepID=A0ACB8SRF3_9AGAM|nr:hypothetical protein BV25DRAFT_1840668 [Artomyces pyxidatus]